MAEAPRVFVTGYPLGHSRSPLIHGTWLKRYGLAGSYQAVEIAPAGFAGFVETIRDGQWAGGNVTTPHKETAFALADRRDKAAEAIGAVNTFWMEDGKLVGSNTDAYGFRANLDHRLAGWRDGETALVLGAGGASRAVVFALRDAGFRRIDIVNRTVGRAETLAQRFGPSVHASGWDKASRLVRDADLIVNTTTLGMDGQPPMNLDLAGARSGAMATDIVYAPLETPFLKSAAAARLKTCDGLGMLLHQAAPGFARWFGETPAVDEELRRIVISALEERPAG